MGLPVIAKKFLYRIESIFDAQFTFFGRIISLTALRGRRIEEALLLDDFVPVVGTFPHSSIDDKSNGNQRRFIINEHNTNDFLNYL